MAEMAFYGGIIPRLYRTRWKFYSRYDSGTPRLVFPVSFLLRAANRCS
jgi:hypothetical protein